MAEYTESFAQFILEAKRAYEELCELIEQGKVEPDNRATVRIDVPARVVDAIRRERALLAETN